MSISKPFWKAVLPAIGVAAGAATLIGAASLKAPARGIDLSAMDRTVNPGDDFFRYANGSWLKTVSIPPDRSSFGVFAVVDEEVEKRTAELIRTAGRRSGSGDLGARKVRAYYDAYMDESAIERKGLRPLEADLHEIDSIADPPALARVLGGQLRADVDPLNAADFHTDRLFGVWVSPDFADPDRNVAYLLQGGLGMPDRDNYRNSDPRERELQEKYRAHIAAICKLAGIPDAEGAAGRVYGLENAIADAHVSRTESVDVEKANNPWSLAEFSKQAPGIDWPVFFDAAGLSRQPKIIVWQPSAVTGIAALVAARPLSVWKEYLKVRAIDRASALLPKAFAEESFRFYGTALTGAPRQRDRWKRAAEATSTALGDEVGRLYVRRYFPARAKEQAQAMVRNIEAAFARRIDRLDWMSPETREKAKAKLETLYVGIGYPEHWRDYSGLAVDADALANLQRSGLFDYHASLARLGQRVDKSQWWMTPQTVNAVNLPLQNALNFPAAILNPPFFDMNAEPVLNYGAIGSIIGHEISHSFDDQGSRFDASGRLRNWWTPQDFAHFTAVGERLAREFDNYEPLPGSHVNGKLTLSENIADVAGLSASFDGYRSEYGSRPAPDRQGFTGDERFFLAFAQAWRSKQRPEALRIRLMTDGHAPPEYRADTVRNVDAWYSAFAIQPQHKLYLSPEARVRVW